MSEKVSQKDHKRRQHDSAVKIDRKPKGQWHKNESSDKISVDNEAFKRVVAECKEKGLNRNEISLVAKKWNRREYRRLKRQNDKQRRKVCFNCRKPGHQLADCPEVLGSRDFSVGVCFKCGSTEHTVAQCRLKIKHFPYAKCFVCGQTGHLSRNCEENPNGAFPEGGSCKQCGAQDHMKKDCPTLFKEKETKKSANYVSIATNMQSADDDGCAFVEESISSSTDTAKKGQPKVVRF